MYIDTHCHVFSEYYDNIEKLFLNVKIIMLIGLLLMDVI